MLYSDQEYLLCRILPIGTPCDRPSHVERSITVQETSSSSSGAGAVLLLVLVG
jgi:hypothetical protein